MRSLGRRPSPFAFAVVLLPFVVSAASSACSSSSSSDGGDGGTTGDDGGGSTPQGGDASTPPGDTDSGSAPGTKCKKNDECASKVCDIATGICKAPTCTDGTKNQDEVDIDCGGACPKCDILKACKGNADCTSGVCADTGKGKQCQPPACDDVVKNGSESDVDCGGDKCAKCADGKACKVRGDCASDVCTGGKCITPVCDDLAKNGTETDVDCGGPGCDGCATGQTCTTGTDCASLGCNYQGKCAAGRSCTQQYGGDTCGLGGENGVPAQWEDCCIKQPVVPTTGPTAGKTIMMDKYQVTAGRMRVFLESIGYDVRGFVQQARADGKIPMIPRQTGTNAGYSVLESTWDMYLPTSFAGNTNAGELAERDQGDPTPQPGIYTSIANHLGGRIFYGNEQGSTGCYVGSPGTHAFRFPDGQQDGDTPDFGPDVYDTKSMQCIDYLVAQAFCVWEGGRLHLGAEFQAAWGPGALPWSAETTRTPAVIGDATYWGCRFPWVGDANYPDYCTNTGAPGGTPLYNPATQTIEYADYRYSYEYPKQKNADYIVFISAPGRTRGRGPNGHADIIGTNMGWTSDVIIGSNNATPTNATDGNIAYDGTPRTATSGWAQNGSWEVHGYGKGLGWRNFLLNKYGKLGLRCAFE